MISMGFLAIQAAIAIFKFFTKKSIAIVILLTMVTFLLGTFGFKHYENKGIEEDNEAIIQDYFEENNMTDTSLNRSVALGSAGDLTDPYDYQTSFYWTFTTVTTVGFGDFSPATSEGRVVYYFVGLAGISVIGIIIGELGSHLVELSFMKMRGLGKSKFKNHVIIVGWNPSTEVAHTELKTRGMKCVVIDETKDFMEMRELGVDLVVGNAIDTEVLKKAGIERAKVLLLPIKSDEDTVMISLKARRLNRSIRIIADVNDRENSDIIHDAGVTTMIPSTMIRGLLMANAIEENLVVDFIVDICQEYEGLDISQHVLDKPMRIKDIPIGRKDKIITAYRKGEAFLDFTPETKLNKGDWILSLTYNVRRK